MTGATSGLGRQLVWALCRRGQSVLAAGRRPDAVDQLCREIDGKTPGSASPFVADLGDLDAVNAAIDEIDGLSLRGIATNAGLSSVADRRSAQGYELTFAVNVLAHQLLLCRLAPRVVKGGRIVCVSSGTHDPGNRLARFFRIPVPRWVGILGQARPETLPQEDRLGSGSLRYSTSKLCNILQARGLQARLRSAGRDVDVFAMDPGLMVDTDLARDAPAAARWALRAIGRLATPFVENMRLSTTTQQHLASILLDDRWHGKGFAYVDGDRIRPPSADALRDDLVEELWRDSAPLIGVRQESVHWGA